mgnify:CR=1 FL=1
MEKHIAPAFKGGMARDFEQLIREIEQEAAGEGPRAMAELDALDVRFRLAAQLLAARRRAGLSQRQLAAASGVQQAEISRIERGEITPRLTTMERLLAPLGCRLAIVPDPERTPAGPDCAS